MHPRPVVLVLVLAASMAFAAVVFGGGPGPTASRRARSRGAAHGSGFSSLPLTLRLAVMATAAREEPRSAVRRVDGRLSARGGGLASTFARSGPTITSGSSRLSLSLLGVGYGARPSAPPAAVPVASADAALYDRGNLTESYASSAAGLEQSFTLTSRPAGAPDGRLTLIVGYSGDLGARQSGSSVRFSTPASHSTVLRYGGLAARDATGRVLPSRLTLQGGHILLAVDDSHARFPITIDPLLEQAALTPTGEVGKGEFGIRVALSSDGSTALIGAPADNSKAGAAWVFTRTGSTWTQQEKLVGGTEEEGAGRLGWGVALSGNGNTAVISSGIGLGTWIFTRSGEKWTQLGTKLAAGDGPVAVSSDGDTLAVVAGTHVNVYTRSGTTWLQQQTVEGSGGTATGNPYSAVALSPEGNTLVMGDKWFNLQAGEAYIWFRSEGKWTQQLALSGSGSSQPMFGSSAALSGEASATYAVIGAEQQKEGEEQEELAGRAFVYMRTGASWAAQTTLTYTPANVEAHFGASVAISADGATVLVGASHLNPVEGARYGAELYARSGTGWSEKQLVTSTTPLYASAALSSSANTMLVGSPEANSSAGAAAVYELSGTTAALASSSNPATVGQAITYTATVTPSEATGTVAFKEGEETITGCGAQTVNAGIATCVLASGYASTGTRMVAAVYSGDGSHSGSSSPAVAEKVNPAATATLLESSMNPTRVGAALTYTADGLPTAAGGTVEFKDASVTIASCSAQAVSMGAATCSIAGGYAAVGGHSITAVYSGDANYLGSTSSALEELVDQAVTTTTLESSLNPATVGAAVTYTATGLPLAATGTVEFRDGGSLIAACKAQTLSEGAATCLLLRGYPATGSHAIAAVYSGDGNYQPSTSPTLTEHVNQAPTSTTVESTQDPSTVGAAVTYTAHVPADATGTVAFLEHGATLAGCDAQPVSSGTATCLIAGGYAVSGERQITAVYSGDENYAGSSSPELSQRVTVAPSTTALESSPNPASVGQPVTFAALVPLGAEGTVEFKDGAGAIPACAAQPVSSGAATCVLADGYASAGSHWVTAAYSGDANHLASTSAPVIEEIEQATTEVTVASSLNPATAGGPVTYSARISPAPDAGLVSFTDNGATPQGCDALSVDGSGAASCTVTYTAAGSHQVTAAYSGDGNYAASASAVLGESVDPEAAATVRPPLTEAEAEALMLQCPTSEIALTRIALRGSQVTIAGIAARTLYGDQVQIFLSGSAKAVQRVLIGATGQFRAGLRAPRPGSARAGARYFALVRVTAAGKTTAWRSAAIPLTRRLYLHRPVSRAGLVTVSGSLARPLSTHPALIVITQRSNCSQGRVVAKVRPGSRGRYTATFPAPAGVGAAVYNVRTRVLRAAGRKATEAVTGLAQAIDTR